MFGQGLLGDFSFLGNQGNPNPQMGLLGGLYDPAEESRLMMRRGLLASGIAMLNQKPSPYPINFGTSLGEGLSAGMQAADAASQNYRRNAFDMYGLKTAADERAYQHGRDAMSDAWNAKTQARQEGDWKREDQQRGYIDQMIGGVDPQYQPLARAFPGEFAKQKFETMFPKPAQPTDDMREYNAAVQQGFNGTFFDYMQQMKRAGATTIDMKGQNSYAQERGKGFATRANEMDQAELAATKGLNALSVMDKQMSDPNFYSGFGAKQVQTLRSAIVAMGGDPNQVSSMETFGAQSKQLALDAMGGSLGTGFSNADRDFVEQQVPNIGNTPEGNRSLIAVQRAIMQRKIEVARIARQYEADHGQLDAGFFQQLSQWAEANPLFANKSGSMPSDTGLQEYNWTPEKGLH